MDREVIDLCGSSPEAPTERSRDKGERRRKRRRLDVPDPRSVVELSDGEDEELVADRRLARRMQDEERSHCRADPDADLALARQLQDEEEQHAQEPPRLGDMFGRGGSPGFPPPGARGSHWDWLGSLARSRPGDDWLGGLLGAGGPGGAPFGPAAAMDRYAELLGGAGMPPRPSYRRPGGGQFGHLQFMDRDFNEADYEMLLRLDEGGIGAQKKKRRQNNNVMLDQLPCRRASKSDAKSDATCAICLDNLRANQNVITLPCKHEYHKLCILKWLKSCDAPSCPTCKAPVLGAPSPEHCPGVSSSSAGGVVASTDDAAAEDERKEEWYHTT